MVTRKIPLEGKNEFLMNNKRNELFRNVYALNHYAIILVPVAIYLAKRAPNFFITLIILIIISSASCREECLIKNK